MLVANESFSLDGQISFYVQNLYIYIFMKWPESSQLTCQTHYDRKADKLEQSSGNQTERLGVAMILYDDLGLDWPSARGELLAN